MTESRPPDADVPAPGVTGLPVPGAVEVPAPGATEMPAPDAAEPSIAGLAMESAETVTLEPVARPGAPATRPAPRGSVVGLGYLAAALAGALLLAGSLAAGGLLGRAAPSPSPTLAPTPTPAPNAADGPSLGSPSAAVTIEIWADYQCPFCRLETTVFGGSLERAYVLPGLARIVYRDFAFLGQESIDAAVAARCAGRQDPGAYWRYHDLLFASQSGENQGTFKRANLVALAGIASLNATAFTACLDDPAEARAVAAETAQGRGLGIQSTPTLRVSGPGGTRILTGFSNGWSDIRDTVAAASSPPPTASPPGESSVPGSTGLPTAVP
jgi:protein-disulfide isomerase